MTMNAAAAARQTLRRDGIGHQGESVPLVPLFTLRISVMKGWFPPGVVAIDSWQSVPKAQRKKPATCICTVTWLTVHQQLTEQHSDHAESYTQPRNANHSKRSARGLLHSVHETLSDAGVDEQN